MSSKNTKVNATVSFFAAVWVVITMISVGYTAFVAAVMVGGKTNLFMAAPAILTVSGTIVVAIFIAISQKIKSN